MVQRKRQDKFHKLSRKKKVVPLNKTLPRIYGSRPWYPCDRIAGEWVFIPLLSPKPFSSSSMVMSSLSTSSSSECTTILGWIVALHLLLGVSDHAMGKISNPKMKRHKNHEHNLHVESHGCSLPTILTYCGWKKSCTTLDA